MATTGGATGSGTTAGDSTLRRLAAGTETLTIQRTGDIENLQAFDLRNGRLEDVKSLLVKATIGRVWHWRPIMNMQPIDAHRNLGAYILQALAALAPTGAMPETVTRDQRRKCAIVLGTARASITQFYRIEDGDIIPGEKGESWLEVALDSDGNPVMVPTDIVPAASRAVLVEGSNLTQEELAVIPAIHMCCLGILPVQGFSLMMTGHHYLSDPKSQSFKAFNVMERAHMNGREISDWWNADLDLLRDVLWHKVGHPINLTVKKRLAFNTLLPKKLIAAGAGPAASRLPAMESELRAASSYVTLLSTVRPLLNSYGGVLDYNLLLIAVDTVKLFPPEAPTEVFQVPLPPGTPAYVNTRSTAIEYLQGIMERNKDIVAFCYGFYVALSDAAAMQGAATTTDTLKVSFALTKLKGQSHASYNAGLIAFGDYNAARNAARQAGEFNPPNYAFE